MERSNRLRIAAIAMWVVAVLSLGRAAGQASSPAQEYVPLELQISDSQTKAYADSADKFAQDGKYVEALQQLQKALDRCTASSLIADKALVEAKVGFVYFVQGKLEAAKQLWLSSFAGAVKATNLVLQADTLVALAGMAQAIGNTAEALDLETRALDLARKSKNLFVQSRCLGELGNLQHMQGKPKEAQPLVEEALRIDRLNHYQLEAWHLLVLAWIAADESNLDEAMQLATSSRQLAIQDANYLTFSLASGWIGQNYVRKGQLNDGIKFLEQSFSGISADGKPLFANMNSYRVAMELPLPRVTMLAAMADAYQAGQRVDDAFKTWQELYKSAKAAGFSLAAADAAQEIAVIHQNRKEYADAITYYALAAEGWAVAGDTTHRIGVLAPEAFLLGQQGEIEKAAAIYEELLRLVKSRSDTRQQFLFDLALAELIQPRGEFEKTQKALADAESLLSPDLEMAGIQPNFVLELCLREADLHARKNEPVLELVAVEKAMTLAEAVDSKALAAVDTAVKGKLDALQAREAADRAYTSGNFSEALPLLELIQHYEEFHARWNGKSAEYAQGLSKDQIVERLLPLPSKIIVQPGGAEFLEKNLQEMGPVARAVRVPLLMILAGYYITEQRHDLVVKFLSAARPYVNIKQPEPWGVMIVCNLSLSLTLEKQPDAAIKELGPCMEGAQKVGDPKLLAIAHQTNVFVLGITGRPGESRESAQYLLNHKADDPALYTQMAQLLALLHKFPEAIQDWQAALALFAARKDSAGMASAHLGIADALSSMPSRSDEQQSHLESALALYQELKSSEGQIRTSILLAKLLIEKKDLLKAHSYFDAALKLARAANLRELEANVLSEIGQSYFSANQLAKALDSFRASERIYHELHNPGNEAWQLRNEAVALNDLQRPQEALQTAIKSSQLADQSGNWLYRYWARRLMAMLYSNRGDYQQSLAALHEARSISDSANQVQNSAWAALMLAGDLTTLGAWDEALAEINFALPIVRENKNGYDEFLAYSGLIDIYGARESDLKDLDKAVEYYKVASQLLTNPSQSASLDFGIAEVYWQQGKFSEAIEKAKEALSYYEAAKDDWDVASALITLAESQRSSGDLNSAAASLSRAETLVKRVNNFYLTGRLYYGQANLLKQQGQLKEAIAKYERVIDLLEKVKSTTDLNIRRKASESYGFIYDELVDAYYLLSKEDPKSAKSSAESALRYGELNKARIFTNSWGQTFAEVLKRQLPASLQNREQEISSRKEALETERHSQEGQNSRPAARIDEELRKLATEQSALEQEIRQAGPAYAAVRYPQPVALTDLPLHPGELLVEFKLLPDSLAVWMIKGGGNGPELTAFYKVDRPRAWFEERVTAIRNAFNRGQPDLFDPQAAEELFNALFPAPFAQYLSATKIVCVPDDILYLIPFELLSPKASRSEFPLLTQATSYFPSAAAFRLSRITAKAAPQFTAQLFALADPVTSQDDERYVAATAISAIENLQVKSSRPEDPKGSTRGHLEMASIRTRDYFFTRLPDTAVEVKNIAALFSSSPAPLVRTGIEATKRDLLQTDLGRFRFIHFATHGFFPVEPGLREPALILSYDGKDQQRMFLTLSEILELKLHADMVVLSACNTGSGKVTRADGVSSLGSAFLAAGASSATMSLWKVSDKSTAIFMQEFYKKLLAGMGKAEALAAARSALVSKGYNSPFYWAPFVLTGE